MGFYVLLYERVESAEVGGEGGRGSGVCEEGLGAWCVGDGRCGIRIRRGIGIGKGVRTWIGMDGAGLCLFPLGFHDRTLFISVSPTGIDGAEFYSLGVYSLGILRFLGWSLSVSPAPSRYPEA